MAFFLTAVALSSGCKGTSSSSSPAVPMPPPFSVVALSGANSITVSWSAVFGADSYRLYRSVSTPVSKTSGSLISTGSSATSYTDKAVSALTRYYYVMTTVQAGVESAESLEVSAVMGNSGTVSGLVLYEDKEYDQSGFTGNISMKAVRYATVEIINAATSGVLYSARTDSRGAFSIAVTPVPTTVYVRALSEAVPAAVSSVSVKHLNGAKYAIPSINLSLAGSASVSIMVPEANPAGGAFNILDVMTNGFAFIEHLSGSSPAIPLQAFWETGNQAGTYFCTGCPFPGDGIYVINTSTDTDEFDDDVLWHEFGHFVAYNYSQDDSPGGIHYLTDNDLDMRLSWSEGWGDFFPGAIKTWLNANGQSNLISSAAGVPLTNYVDTSRSGGFSFDFGNPSVNGNYSTSEVSIAKLLTDLETTYTMNNIWDVVTSFKSVIPTDPVNLELFWDRWKSIYSSAPAATIYTNRLIDYSDDSYESNNTTTNAKIITVSVPQDHKLYSDATWPTVDIDYVKFGATAGLQYTITTSNLHNGADTYLTLYDADGTTEIVTSITTRDNTSGIEWLAGNGFSACTGGQNYDCYIGSIWYDAPLNNTTSLASRIVWHCVSGRYYIKVTSSPNRPKSAGKYGSYTLNVTSP